MMKTTSGRIRFSPWVAAGTKAAFSPTKTCNALRVPDFRGPEIHPGYNARVNPGSQKKKALAAAVSLAALASMNASAVYLDPEGLGQALIYPYYTVRSVNGNAFNTYVSVINHEATTKALRVRFREGLNGREVAGFNLFLSTFDTWTGSLVPTADVAKVVTTDNSCTTTTFNADALVELTTQHFYRNYTDPYPDWNAAEVTPLSYFSSEGKLYRMAWSRGVDAVSSVLMRTGVENEFILDANTRSETDWVITFPTRRFYVSGSSVHQPSRAAPTPPLFHVFHPHPPA